MGKAPQGRLWPFHLKPLPDELLSSWLVRLATAHRTKLYTFCRLTWPGKDIWNRDIDKSVGEEVLATLVARTATASEVAERTCLRAYEGLLYESHNAYGNTPWIMPVGVYHQIRRRYGLQYCPYCLAEDPVPYFRRNWRLACMAICPRHRIQLHDRCSGCGEPVNFHRGELGRRNKRISDPVTRCPWCGHDLRSTAVPSATELLPAEEVTRQADLLAVIERGWVEIPGSGPVYSHLYFAVLHRLIWLLASNWRSGVFRSAACWRYSIAPFELQHRGNRIEIERIAVLDRRLLLGLALRFMADWPDGLLAVCRAHRIWSSRLLRDLEAAPFWYWRVVREQLYLPSYLQPAAEARWHAQRRAKVRAAANRLARSQKTQS